MNDRPPDYEDSDELDTRKPLFLRVVALVVVLALVLLVADLFFDLVMGWLE